MVTALVTHAACLDHVPHPRHPESPRRLEAILKALDEPEFAGLLRREARRATRDAIERVHDPAHVDLVLDSVPRDGVHWFDPDTAVSPGSGEAAMRAAGAVVTAVDLVMSGEARNAFCAVRPPGHHAEPNRPMGFCLFNNVAVGALHARAAHGLRRIAVVDFDVHHGNGTQSVFETDSDLFYASTHQSPLYPGSGAASETGVGNIVNVPLPPQSGSDSFRAAMRQTVLPALAEFGPDFVFISAGFDAHRDDPLANLRLVEEDYAWVTCELCLLAERKCGARVVSALEGGYNATALARSVAAHMRALMDGPNPGR